jgi:MFS family permease
VRAAVRASRPQAPAAVRSPEERNMESSGRFSRATAIGILSIVAATYVVNAMDRIVFATLLPSVAKEFGFTLLAGGFLATIFTFGFGIAGIPGGFVLDRMSRRAVAIVGICVYSVCTALTCLSVGFYDMAIYRVVSGIGEALQNTAIFTMSGAYFAHNRTLAFGLLNTAYGIGSFIGPRWGAHLLAQSGSWRLPLYVFSVIGLVGALAMLLLVPRRFAEWRGHELRTAVDAEHHIPEGLINRNTVLVAVVAVTGGIAGFGYLGLYPTFLRTELDFSVEEAGAAASMFGAGALMGLLCGYLADRINQKWLLIVSLAVLGLVGYCLFNVATTPFWQSALSFLEGSVQSGFFYVNSYSLMQRSVRSNLTGRASGLFVTCVYLPAAFSGYIFAALVGWIGWHGAALLQMCLLLAVPIFAMLFFELAKTSCPAPAQTGRSL